MTTMSFHSGHTANFRALPARKAAAAPRIRRPVLASRSADALRATGHFALALVPFSLLAWMFVAR